MNNWLLGFYALNTLSGVLLVALGALAAFRPNQKTRALPVFFMAWGTQLVLSNIAAGTTDTTTAHLLFWLAQAFLPLQGLLLLYYASEKSLDASLAAPSRRLYNLCRAASLVVLACAVVGGLVALFASSQVLSVATRSDGTHTTQFGFWSLLFDAPQYLGIALALLVLAWRTPSTTATRKDWLLLVGLCIAWAYSLAHPLSLDLQARQHDVWRDAVVSASLLLIALAVIQLFRAAQKGEATLRRRNTALPLLVLVALLALFAKQPLGPLYVLLAPGLFRVAALALLVPALWYSNVGQALRDAQARRKIVPITVALISVVLAAALGLAALAAIGLPEAWTLYGSTLALAGPLLIGWLGGHTLLLRPAV